LFADKVNGLLCDVKSTLTVSVGDIQLSPQRDQELNDENVTVLRGDMDWGIFKLLSLFIYLLTLAD
jgi:hypothetical protein